MATEQLIAGLNEQLNREVSTALRYILQSASIKGAEWDPVRDMYKAEVTDEIGHAQYLANQIEMLGFKPSLEPKLDPPPADVKEMLKADASQEREDVTNYTRLAAMAESEGQFALKLQLEQQAGDEDEHRQKMLRMLG